MGDAIESTTEPLNTSSSSGELKQISISVAIDATKLATAFEISTSYQAMMGGKYLNHFISTQEMDKSEIEAILKGTSKTLKLQK
eukprot:12780206-Ditylum_brightwellii.AAC.1